MIAGQGRERMIEMYLGVVSVLFGLFIFGLAFNQGVAWAKPRGYLEPYLAFWVAAGCGATLIGVGIVDTLVSWNAGLIGLVCFAASGAPMMVGDMARYVRTVQREKEAWRDEG